MAPNTLATYLSMMTTSGEVERHGDFYRGAAPVPSQWPTPLTVGIPTASSTRQRGGMSVSPSEDEDFEHSTLSGPVSHAGETIDLEIYRRVGSQAPWRMEVVHIGGGCTR